MCRSDYLSLQFMDPSRFPEPVCFQDTHGLAKVRDIIVDLGLLLCLRNVTAQQGLQDFVHIDALAFEVTNDGLVALSGIHADAPLLNEVLEHSKLGMTQSATHGPNPWGISVVLSSRPIGFVSGGTALVGRSLWCISYPSASKYRMSGKGEAETCSCPYDQIRTMRWSRSNEFSGTTHTRPAIDSPSAAITRRRNR